MRVRSGKVLALAALLLALLHASAAHYGEESPCQRRLREREARRKTSFLQSVSCWCGFTSPKPLIVDESDELTWLDRWCLQNSNYEEDQMLTDYYMGTHSHGHGHSHGGAPSVFEDLGSGGLCKWFGRVYTIFFVTVPSLLLTCVFPWRWNWCSDKEFFLFRWSGHFFDWLMCDYDYKGQDPCTALGLCEQQEAERLTLKCFAILALSALPLLFWLWYPLRRRKRRGHQTYDGPEFHDPNKGTVEVLREDSFEHLEDHRRDGYVKKTRNRSSSLSRRPRRDRGPPDGDGGYGGGRGYSDGQGRDYSDRPGGGYPDGPGGRGYSDGNGYPDGNNRRHSDSRGGGGRGYGDGEGRSRGRRNGGGYDMDDREQRRSRREQYDEAEYFMGRSDAPLSEEPEDPEVLYEEYRRASPPPIDRYSMMQQRPSVVAAQPQHRPSIVPASQHRPSMVAAKPSGVDLLSKLSNKRPSTANLDRNSSRHSSIHVASSSAKLPFSAPSMANLPSSKSRNDLPRSKSNLRASGSMHGTPSKLSLQKKVSRVRNVLKAFPSKSGNKDKGRLLGGVASQKSVSRMDRDDERKRRKSGVKSKHDLARQASRILQSNGSTHSRSNLVSSPSRKALASSPSRKALASSRKSLASSPSRKALASSPSRKALASSRKSLASSPSRKALASSPSRKALASSPSRKALASSRKSLASSPSRKSLPSSPSRKSLPSSPSRKALASSPSRKALASSPSRKGLTSRSRKSLSISPSKMKNLELSPSDKNLETMLSATDARRSTHSISNVLGKWKGLK